LLLSAAAELAGRLMMLAVTMHSGDLHVCHATTLHCLWLHVTKGHSIKSTTSLSLQCSLVQNSTICTVALHSGYEI
jgi:hypothetical protein